MKETMPSKSNRSFTKRFVSGNLFLIWVTILFSIWMSQAEFVVPQAFALIGLLFGVYTGVGHLDYRKAIELSIDRLTKGNGSRSPDREYDDVG